MEEIFYKNYFGRRTVTISIVKREDDTYSVSLAKYADKSKHSFVGHFQFSLEKEDFKELIQKLNEKVNG